MMMTRALGAMSFLNTVCVIGKIVNRLNNLGTIIILRTSMRNAN